MDIVNQIIASMKKEEIRFFKLLAARSHASEERKDILLFDYIRKKSEKYNENEIQAQLYEKTDSVADKNAFYRLKNRLLSDLNQSQWLLHHEDDALTFDIYLFSLARMYKNQKNINVSWYYLKKAEKSAIENENFEVLDLIYSLYIQLSYEDLSLNPEKYIKLRHENRKKWELIGEIDDMLARVSYKIRVSLNASKDSDLLFELQKKVDELGKMESVKRSIKIRFKIYHVLVRILLQKDEYKLMEIYLRETFDTFEKEGLFNKQTHNTKLQILTYLMNTLYLLGNHEASLTYTEKLKEAMLEYGAFLYSQYELFYFNSLVVNYSVVNKNKAIEIFNQLKKELPQKKITSLNHLFIYLNLALLYFSTEQYRKSLRNLNELYLTNEYKELGDNLKLRIGILEALNLRQTQNEDLSKNKIVRLQKEFQSLLKTEEHKIDAHFLLFLLNILAENSSLKIKEMAIHYLAEDEKFPQPALQQVLDYKDWIKTRLI
jgi:hypothetical protein